MVLLTTHRYSGTADYTQVQSSTADYTLTTHRYSGTADYTLTTHRYSGTAYYTLTTHRYSGTADYTQVQSSIADYTLTTHRYSVVLLTSRLLHTGTVVLLTTRRYSGTAYYTQVQIFFALVAAIVSRSNAADLSARNMDTLLVLMTLAPVVLSMVLTFFPELMSLFQISVMGLKARGAVFTTSYFPLPTSYLPPTTYHALFTLQYLLLTAH